MGAAYNPDGKSCATFFCFHMSREGGEEEWERRGGEEREREGTRRGEQSRMLCIHRRHLEARCGPGLFNNHICTIGLVGIAFLVDFFSSCLLAFPIPCCDRSLLTCRHDVAIELAARVRAS